MSLFPGEIDYHWPPAGFPGVAGVSSRRFTCMFLSLDWGKAATVITYSVLSGR